MGTKALIYDLERAKIGKVIEGWGEPSYRRVQIWDGLYKQLWARAEDFTNLSKGLRERLGEHFSFSHLKTSNTQHSSDGQTTKSLFALPDGNAIETVLMRYDERRTLCISTQAGCALGCTFCATGQMGFRSNLSSGEIVEQVIVFARQLKAEGERVTNVVLMGMGEPFQNYKASLGAIDRLNNAEGFRLSARRFTISTVGLIPAIKRFTREKRQVRLAISLHAADDKLRSSMLPINKRYPVAELMDACRDYVEESGRRITFEWAMVQGVNDSVEQAQKLSALLVELNCHVNLIPLNSTKGFDGQQSSRQRIADFREVLISKGISCTVRVRRGIDIHAGCGQLAERESSQVAGT